MIGMLARLGRWARRVINDLGFAGRFLMQLLWASLLSLKRPRLISEQVYFVGNRSLSIILISGLFVGFVLGLQGYYNLERYGAESSLGLLVALSLLRELGPVLAAILFASSAGGAMTSEIGLMKTTEQLEAMNVMAVNPVARVVAPRFWAGVFSMPLLASIFNVAGIYGAYLVGVTWLGLDSGIFWSQMQNNITIHYDVINGLIKSAAFGVAVTLIAVHQGFHCVPTSEGILRASTRTVVSSALTILAIDFVLTALMFTE